MKVNSANSQTNVNTNHSSNPQEEQLLARQCAAIRANVNASFSSRGARNSSGCQNMRREAITDYLLSVGTPTALELLQEFEQHGF